MALSNRSDQETGGEGFLTGGPRLKDDESDISDGSGFLSLQVSGICGKDSDLEEEPAIDMSRVRRRKQRDHPEMAVGRGPRKEPSGKSQPEVPNDLLHPSQSDQKDPEADRPWNTTRGGRQIKPPQRLTP